AYLVITMPQGKSLRGAAAEMLPWIGTPTPIRRVYMPTRTPTPSPTPVDSGISPAALLGLGTAFPSTSTPSEPTLEVPAAAPTATPAPIDPMACLKGLKRQEGTVLEVLDGNTLRVLMEDGLVYPVRYIGVDVPAKDRQAEAAWEKNTDLVYGKKVTLLTDASDRDPRGRLLRYVVVGETFVNLDLIVSGWGLPLSTPPDTSCDETFAQSEQAARGQGIGIWAPTPRPGARPASQPTITSED
ncbi:MAG TPA: thermonuclease family protein, partial [Anaerolineales bacterium]